MAIKGLRGSFSSLAPLRLPGLFRLSTESNPAPTKMFKIAIIVAVGLATAFAFPMDPSSGLESSGDSVLLISDIDASGIQIDPSGLQIAELDISGIEGSGVSGTESSGIEIDHVTIDQIELVREKRNALCLTAMANEQNELGREKRSALNEESSGYETSGTETAVSNEYNGMRFRREAEASGQEPIVFQGSESSGNEATVVFVAHAEGSGILPAKCESMASCTAPNECNGGQCLGAFVGTCNCLPCISFLGCTTDAQCGGLKNACNTTTGLCDCNAGYVSNGFTDSTDALLNFCNIKQCTASNSNSTCFGLPCNKGNCFC